MSKKAYKKSKKLTKKLHDFQNLRDQIMDELDRLNKKLSNKEFIKLERYAEKLLQERLERIWGISE